MERDILKLKKWCINKKLQGWKVSNICAHAQIPRRTFYNWLSNYENEGINGLETKSRKPNITYKTSENIIQKIIEIREKYECSDKLIQAILKKEGIEISNSTIYEILKSNSLINYNLKHKQRTYIRWERKHNNSLWQTDISIFKRKYIIAYVDDHSRFCAGINLYNKATTDNCIETLKDAMNNYPKPKQILTDHGSQYYAMRKGENRFDEYCQEQNIEHIMSGIGKPTTQGKIERFFQTIKTTLKIIPDIQKATEYYNFIKPHTSLNYKTPAEIYLQ